MDQAFEPAMASPECADARPPAAGAPFATDWQRAVRLPSFRSLLRAKLRILVPLAVLYLAFFLGISLAAGFAKPFMTQKVFGPLNMGYALIIATYVMSWLIALFYVRVANRDFDAKACAAIAELAMLPGRP